MIYIRRHGHLFLRLRMPEAIYAIIAAYIRYRPLPQHFTVYFAYYVTPLLIIAPHHARRCHAGWLITLLSFRLRCAIIQGQPPFSQLAIAYASHAPRAPYDVSEYSHDTSPIAVWGPTRYITQPATSHVSATLLFCIERLLAIRGALSHYMALRHYASDNRHTAIGGTTSRHQQQSSPRRHWAYYC